MIFCAYCGSRLTDSDRFCPNCGATLKDAIVHEEPTASAASTSSAASAASSKTGEGGYEVVLSGLGSCENRICNDLLEDLLGYSDKEADLLIRQVPVRIASNLSLEQARTLVQALAEYGIEVSLLYNEEAVDPGLREDSSVYNSDGSLVRTALAILSGITAAQRVTEIRTVKKPSLLERFFSGLFKGSSKRPHHIRRPIHHPVTQRDHPEPPPAARPGVNLNQPHPVYGHRPASPQMSSPVRPGQVRPPQNRPSGGQSGQIRPSQNRPSNARPPQARPSHGSGGQGRPHRRNDGPAH